MPDNISDSISTTGRVTVGNSLTGEIETTNDSDAYAVELVAGRTYRIDLEGAATDKGTLADPFLRWLRDSSGNGLHGTRDYDGGEGLNPRQVFTPQVSGIYYITAPGLRARGPLGAGVAVLRGLGVCKADIGSRSVRCGEFRKLFTMRRFSHGVGRQTTMKEVNHEEQKAQRIERIDRENYQQGNDEENHRQYPGTG